MVLIPGIVAVFLFAVLFRDAPVRGRPMSLSGDSVGMHFGPMHGERSRRHQMVVAGSQREGIEQIIVTVYELHDTEQPQEAVELTHGLGVGAYARADLTVAEASALRDWLDEFVRAYA